MSLRTNGASSCAANTPTCGVFHGALCGPCLPSEGPSRSGQSCLHTPTIGASHGSILCGACFGLHLHLHLHSHSGGGGASSPHLHMPSFGGSHSGILDSPESSCGNSSGGGSWSSLHSMLFALGSNASGLVVVASIAPLAGSTLAMPSVGAGATCTSNNTPPSSRMLTTACLVASVPTFSAA